VIAVVGEALFDPHRDGDLLRLFLGGGPPNTGIALGHPGAPACFIAAISEDRLGRQLKSTLQAAGVDTGRVVEVDASTPIAIVDSILDEPSYSFYAAAAAAQCAGASAWGPTAADVARLLKEAGATSGPSSREESEWHHSSSTA